MEEAGRVAGSAADAGREVADTANGKLQNVADEAKTHAEDFYRQTQQEWRKQAAQRTQPFAGWLDQRDPKSLLDEIVSYARRNPGTFIAGAPIAGALAFKRTFREFDTDKCGGHREDW